METKGNRVETFVVVVVVVVDFDFGTTAGGVGGVHRGAETDMDISADLTELGRTPVAVVSSGVRSPFCLLTQTV